MKNSKKLSLDAFKASVQSNNAEKSISNFSNSNVLGSLAKITGGLLGACHY